MLNENNCMGLLALVSCLNKTGGCSSQLPGFSDQAYQIDSQDWAQFSTEVKPIHQLAVQQERAQDLHSSLGTQIRQDCELNSLPDGATGFILQMEKATECVFYSNATVSGAIEQAAQLPGPFFRFRKDLCFRTPSRRTCNPSGSLVRHYHDLVLHKAELGWDYCLALQVETQSSMSKCHFSLFIFLMVSCRTQKF